MIINILYILKTTSKLVSIFSKIDDSRRDLTKLHQLNDILLIGIISVICGADSWNEMELYAQEKEDFLRTFLELPNGIPSHDTFNRVFSAIDSKQFELCFIEWVKTLAQLTDKEIIAIDGKTIRGAKDKGKKSHSGHSIAQSRLSSTFIHCIRNRNTPSPEGINRPTIDESVHTGKNLLRKHRLLRHKTYRGSVKLAYAYRMFLRRTATTSRPADEQERVML